MSKRNHKYWLNSPTQRAKHRLSAIEPYRDTLLQIWRKTENFGLFLKISKSLGSISMEKMKNFRNDHRPLKRVKKWFWATFGRKFFFPI
jgi:hypothetical protein